MPVPPADDVYSIKNEGFNPAAMLEPTYDIPEGYVLQESQEALEQEVHDLREELARIRRTMNRAKAPAEEVRQLDQDLRAAEKLQL